MKRLVLGHTEYFCESGGNSNDAKVLGYLPLHLRIKIGDALSEEKKLIKKLLHSTSKISDRYMECLLALKLRPISCNKNEYLFQKNDLTKALYLFY